MPIKDPTLQQNRLKYYLIAFFVLLVASSTVHAAPSIVSPASGTVLAPDASVTWSAGGTPNTAWWLYAGSSQGARDYLNSGQLPASQTSASLTGLPLDGSDVFVRLWYKPNATTNWQFVDATYQASEVQPTIGLEPADTRIRRSSEPVSWSANGWPVTQWWLYAGSAAGKSEFYNSGLIGSATTTSATVTNLPLDGSRVHLRLWYRNATSGWEFVDTSIRTVDQSTPPALTQPASGTEIDSQTQLSWTDNGTSTTGWWVYAGSTAGAKNYMDSGFLSRDTNQMSFSGLPENGETVHVTLWYRVPAGTWLKVAYTFDTAGQVSVPDLNEYELVFNDEFSGSTLDPAKWDTGLLWGPYSTINNEEQLYVDSLGMHSSLSYSPFEMTGSSLKITASEKSSSTPIPPRPPEDSPLWQPRPYSEYRYNGPVGNPGDENYNPGFREQDVDYLSGIITSYGSFKMAHGYVEARAKLPPGRGLWPAFWMLPTHYVEDVPEIDVMEFLGQDVDTIYHTYHYFDIEDNWRLISTPSYTTLAEDWTEEFHTYGMAWSPGQIVWFVDGVETRRISGSNFEIANQAMYLIANVAVGGNWPGSPDASTPFPATFEIDYIRAYKKKLPDTLNLSRDYQLMFNDEFTGSTLDPEKWNTHFLWGPYLPINNEEQYYVDALGSDAGGPSPFSLNNGVLSITARDPATDAQSFSIPQQLPPANASVWTDFPSFQQNGDYEAPNYTSGIITSYDAFKFAHGFAEIRAKVPKGDGLWPAFWLLNGYYVGPQPEIDVMEVRGENPRQIIHSYHRNGAPSNSATTTGGDATDGYADAFHRYGVRWQPGKIDWYIDRQKVFTYEGDDVGYQVMYVLANLAVGGDFNNVPVDSDLFPISLDIDYIRVYQEKDYE